MFLLLFRYSTESKYKLYYKDYVKLYIDTIMSEVTNLELDPHRPFVSSSPSNGIDTEKAGWVAKEPQSTYSGDSKTCAMFRSFTEIITALLTKTCFLLTF